MSRGPSPFAPDAGVAGADFNAVLAFNIGTL
jgi:hypothetical protein